MKNLKKLICLVLPLIILASSCNNINTGKNASITVDSTNAIGLNFNVQDYTNQTITYNDTSLLVRAYEGIIYVSHPVDSNYECMNIYIPEVYFNDGSCGGYNSETAPIFLPNRIGGYMPASPAYLNPTELNTITKALLRGFIVASPGARGRILQDSAGNYTGKAPAAIVDLKAAVRYLKYNDDLIPGDASKIISNGTSAGGALSALLGASGNNSDYQSYLDSLGAADADDDIFAVSAYCPITNLNNADKAYEWQFNSLKADLNSAQSIISDDLSALFPAYLNGLELMSNEGEMFELDEQGEGNFKILIESFLIASAQKALDKGANLSGYNYLTIEQNKVKAIDYKRYISQLGRLKMPPAFDALDLHTPENDLFGTASVNNQHFTEYSFNHSTVRGSLADEAIIRLMNPMDYISNSETDVAPNWRIRHGSKDRDTGLAIPVILATLLENNGADVDFAFAWDIPHSGDYDLDELFDWVDRICQQ